MIHQLDIFGKDKVQTAIDRLRRYEPDEGYYLAFSGGKDSVVLKALADMAGVKYDAHYAITSVDPPELVKFIRDVHPDVKRESQHDKDGKPYTMWNLIANDTMPPTRLARYCCEKLKESGGDGRMTLTGVRWAESANRKNNQGRITIMRGNKKIKEDFTAMNVDFSRTPRGGVVLNYDNDESKQAIERCYRTYKTTINPIIDWTDDEVWEFIKEYKIPYCELYDRGYKRLGCIGCPMATGKGQKREFEKYPKFKNAYLRAFRKMLLNCAKKGLVTNWKTPEAVMAWWVGDWNTKNIEKTNFTDEEIEALKNWKVEE